MDHSPTFNVPWRCWRAHGLGPTTPTYKGNPTSQAQRSFERVHTLTSLRRASTSAKSLWYPNHSSYEDYRNAKNHRNPLNWAALGTIYENASYFCQKQWIFQALDWR